MRRMSAARRFRCRADWTCEASHRSHRRTQAMDALAYFGGSPACPPDRLPAWPHYGPEERQGLARVLESRKWWRGVGSEVDAFEREFAASQQSRYALAVS